MWLLSQSASAPEWSDLLLGPLGALALSLAANVWFIRERSVLKQERDREREDRIASENRERESFGQMLELARTVPPLAKRLGDGDGPS